MQVLSDLQAEQLTGGRRGWMMPRFGRRHLSPGRGAGHSSVFAGASGMFSIQSILNIVNQINVSINIAFGGGSIHNSQLNALTIQSTM
ncbi:MAG: hypothetical protein KFB97_09425 [Cyanobium sp. M30B3]|nr:MAG: hypothetical protein KFB97_09425 [Cyanobium sp. M30B3]